MHGGFVPPWKRAATSKAPLRSGLALAGGAPPPCCVSVARVPMTRVEMAVPLSKWKPTRSPSMTEEGGSPRNSNARRGERRGRGGAP